MFALTFTILFLCFCFFKNAHLISLFCLLFYGVSFFFSYYNLEDIYPVLPVPAAAAKLLQLCPTLCDPIDGSPPGSPVPGILQARTLERVAISSPMHESEKWKWSRSVVSDSLRPHGLQPTRLLHPWDFPGKSTGVGCHCLLQPFLLVTPKWTI